MKNIQVISGDGSIDGADLRKRKKGYYTRCDGSKDDQEINEAVQFAGSGKQFVISGELWEGIFGNDLS